MGSTWALWRKNRRGKSMVKKEKRTNRLQKMGGKTCSGPPAAGFFFFFAGGGGVFLF